MFFCYCFLHSFIDNDNFLVVLYYSILEPFCLDKFEKGLLISVPWDPNRIAMPTVSEIFATMEYGPAPETDKLAQAW
jgi:hypothetical protein